MEARRLSRRILTPKTWKQWVLLGTVGLCISCTIAVASHIVNSSNFNFSWQAWIAIAITVGVFVLNAVTSLPAEAVFLGGTSVLLVSGVLTEQDALAGFSNPGMITVAVLYVVVTGLSQTGGMNWISQQVLGSPKGQNAALLRLMTPVMGMSAFLNNTPVVAMFIPVVSDWSRKLRISPSKLMIPLSYAAIFGGACTLIGTSTNLVVNGLLVSATNLPGLKLFDLAIVGLPCAIAGTIYLFLIGGWLLPNRKPITSDTEGVRQYTVEMMVYADSPLVDKSIEKAGLRHLPGLYLVEIVRGESIFAAVSPQEILHEGDRLVFIGTIDSMIDLHRLRGLRPATDQVFKLDIPRANRCLIEAVVSNSCPLLNKTIRESKFRTRYNAVILAVARNGERLPGKIGAIRLRAGDTLLLEANPEFLSRQRISNDFYLVNGIPDSEPIRHEKAPLAMAILLSMVLLASLGLMSMLKAAILASVAMIMTGCCSSIRALRNIQWSVLLVIGSALSIGKALESTGAAGAIAADLIQLSGENPWLALAIVYGVTNLLTEAITNNAAAALVFPIALALSQNLGVSFMPFAIAIMIGASASFATPIGYQTNLMVYGPGGYHFTDFMRVGIPLNILFCIITMILTPMFFPF
ncbi:MAG: SLC13 family permease [Cyanobacteria bacterium P01_G01_bin.19]